MRVGMYVLPVGKEKEIDCQSRFGMFSLVSLG